MVAHERTEEQSREEELNVFPLDNLNSSSQRPSAQCWQIWKNFLSTFMIYPFTRIGWSRGHSDFRFWPLTYGHQNWINSLKLTVVPNEKGCKPFSIFVRTHAGLVAIPYHQFTGATLRGVLSVLPLTSAFNVAFNSELWVVLWFWQFLYIFATGSTCRPLFTFIFAVTSGFELQ